MSAAVASRTRAAPKARAGRDAHPPTKKAKLAQPSPAARSDPFAALLNGNPNKKAALAAKANETKDGRKDRPVEATAVVGVRDVEGDVDMADAGKTVIEISSGEEEESEDSGSEEDDEQDGEHATAPAVNGQADGDEDPADREELSFGEKLQEQEPESARAPRIVDVEAAFVGPDAETRARPLSAPSATSLGTVLTQALRTNDQDLLDSCLRIIDVDTIYATVERLPSPLVANLLQKLAERLHKKPGRAGILMVWVQWSLAAHGGYLASQPQLVKQLATLNKVLKERASGLQPLLSLKGRLDMLQAQLELRRRNQRKAAGDDDDEAVIYVEGEDDVSSADEDDESEVGSDAAVGTAGKRLRQASDDASSSADEMPTTMEVDEGSEDGSEDSEGLLDDEAEETDDDTGDDMSEPLSDDDLDDGEDVSGSEEESRPARRSTVGRAGIARRY
jgi:U3 small nucleolar RNA-associated protein 5